MLCYSLLFTCSTSNVLLKKYVVTCKVIAGFDKSKSASDEKYKQRS